MASILRTSDSPRFPLARIFVLSLYSLVGLSSLMLTQSEGFENGFPPQALTIPLVILAFIFVDWKERFVLSWWLAGTLGLIAMAVCLGQIWQFIKFKDGVPQLPDEQLLEFIFAGSHLLVYLTWIVLFLKKINQQYWWLWALCVLQIAVGASQSTESIYGILLTCYLFLAVWTLSVFSLWQGKQQFDRAEQTAQLTGFQKTNPPAHEANSLPQKHPLLNPWSRQSSAIGNVQRDPTAAWISPRFLTGVIGTACLAFVTSLIFFLFIPRHPAIWKRNQAPDGGSSRTQSTVGFSRKLELGDIGQILESTKKVMDVRLVEEATGKKLDIERYASQMGFGEPLFRGMTAHVYKNGRWDSWDYENLIRGSEALQRPKFARRDLVRQEIRLQPVDPELLFAMPPAVDGRFGKSAQPVYQDRLTGTLRWDNRNQEKNVIEYSIISPWPEDNQERGRIPLDQLDALMFEQTRSGFYLIVPERLQTLKQMAREQSGYDEFPRPSPMEMAMRLESFLNSRGGFTYTLNADVTDKSIDPIEDFLRNRKQGHCEYFASTLTLMLREIGIPSRLVSGFKGGAFNEITGAFEVEERHAHAWVEAYIDRSWVMFDPTPASRSESVNQVGSSLGRFHSMKNLLKDFWSRFVVGLNETQQRRLIAPIRELATNIVAWLRGGGGQFQAFIKRLSRQLRSPEKWISWQGGLVSFVLLTFLAGVWWCLRAVWRWFTKIRAEYFNQPLAARTIIFYERFRSICNRAGFRRNPAETPKEFAQNIAGQLGTRLEHANLMDFPGQLVSAYYDVRYGSQNLTDDRLRHLEHQLTAFEMLMSQPAN